MKKILLTAAVAAACAVPAAAVADTTLYGNFRWSINDIDRGAAGDSLTANNNASRLGVKGAIGEGSLKGIYHLQMGAQNDGTGSAGAGDSGSALSSRFYFAGLKGGFGSLIYGRHSTAYKMAGLRLDPFYDTSAGPGFGGSSYGLSPLANGFTNNSLAYTTPKLGGAVTVNAALYLDDGAADDHDYNVGVQYGKSGITAGIQYIKTEGTGNIAASGAYPDADAFRLYGGFKNKKFSAGLSYEQIDSAGDADEDKFLFASGSFNVTPKVTLAGSYGKVEDTGVSGGRGDGDGFAFGVFYKILSKTTLNGLYSTTDYDLGGAELDVISLGVVQSF